MKASKTAFYCTDCGNELSRWAGKCPACGAWNTIVEQPKRAAGERKSGSVLFDLPRKASPVTALRQESEVRFPSGIGELDRVLGGGIVKGSLILVGGAPGIGKSTLMLQICSQLCQGGRVLYVSGEESEYQLKLRCQRLRAESENLYVLSETRLSDLLEVVDAEEPEVLIVDSIQTLSNDALDSAAGSIAQVKSCTLTLMELAKRRGITVFVIGHINKEGTLAGPKILEHIVDTVVQFEGDQHYMYRILRSIKNRFGSTSELGIYEMQQGGLRQVSNPSELLLTDDHDGLSGVAISSAIEGVRPFLVETQALVSTAAYGTPQRSATGFDQRRLNMLLAVLEKRVGFKLMQKDVFLNIAGGLRVTDLAMDLSVIAAVLSSNVDTPIEAGWCMAGEVGLSGEVRPVSRIEQRIAEAEKLGFHDIILPRYNYHSLDKSKFSINIHPVRKVEEALRCLFG